MKEKLKLNNNKGKILLILIVLGALITGMIFFIKSDNKNQNIGHTISNQNIEEIEKYILDISSYEAEIEVTVESNKNTNKYLMKQTYQKDKISKQTILEPSNIAGMEMVYENQTLTITNSKLNLTTVYENYTYLAENFLWLDAFVQDYNNAKSANETTLANENDMIIMETKTKNQNNRYVYHKKLYIDKKTGKPAKLVIQDINKKSTVYILYNEIMVNGK